MTKIKTLSELASEDENRFLEDERKQESKAFKIARERMKLKGEINERNKFNNKIIDKR